MLISRQGRRRGHRGRAYVRIAATLCAAVAIVAATALARSAEPTSAASAGTKVVDPPQRWSPSPESRSSSHAAPYTDLRRSIPAAGPIHTVQVNTDLKSANPIDYERLGSPSAESREPRVPYSDLRESISDLSRSTAELRDSFTAPAPIHDVQQYQNGGYLDWTPQLLPNGILYKAYLAGIKESRMATTFEHLDGYGWIWETTLGGRVGLFRFGTSDAVRPEGFQIDLEGSAMPRLNLDHQRDMIAADFRGGVPITYGIGRWQSKLAFYHLSSHLADEFMIANPTFRRVNYSRDVLVLGQSYYLTDALRIYGEAGWAWYSDVGEPWEFQAGVDYSPLVFGPGGAPFAAVNVMSRQEVDFGGNVVVQAGWQWRGCGRSGILRIGGQYYNGKSSQFQLYDFNENRYGFGIWYDF
jgi:hypothetical protein